MRIVKWHPQERVDNPDITAMSYLVLGEFRRFVRGALLGAHDLGTYAVNGFQVLATTPASNAVEVTLADAGALSFAFGAELIGTRVDYGQLMGGDDSDGNTEGNAVQSFDFTGEPAATYTVQMRHVFSDAVPDNRAFWNPGSDTEFVSQVNTRSTPQYQLRVTGAPSNEWMDLADVVWNGSGPIGPGNITDLRDFAFEAQSPWTQTTKLGTGGMPDFLRFADRGGPTIGRNGVYPALRALGRQIQDIKGPDENGEWNWWNDPYSPHDPNSTFARARTTSLRSLRTVHYTVGDGVNTFGDFSGLTLGTGLDACLSHIETENATNDISSHVIIQILTNGDFGNADEAFQVGNYDFGNVYLEIRGGGCRDTGAGDKWWNTRILPAGTLTTEVFDFTTTTGGLSLRDLKFEDPGSPVELFRMQQNTQFEMHNCLINTDADAANPWIDFNGQLDTMHISDCIITAETVINDGVGLGFGEWSRCRFTRKVSVVGAFRVAFRDCYVSLNNADDNNLRISGAGSLRFDNCYFTGLSADYDLVRLDNADGAFSEIEFQSSRFSIFDTSPTHAAGAGTNGSKGTGWLLFIDNDGGLASDAYSIQIQNCILDGSDGVIRSETVDAGAIYIHGCTHVTVDNCDIRRYGSTNAAYDVRGIKIVGASGLGSLGNRITNCMFEQFDLAAGTNYVIELEDSWQTVIQNNTFNGFGGTGIDQFIHLDESSQNVICGNHFFALNSGIAILLTGGVTSSQNTISNNTFSSCSEAVHITAGAGNVVANNTVEGNNNTASVFGVINTQSDETIIQGNRIDNYNGTYDAIRFASCTDCIIMGNISSDGNIDLNSTIGHKPDTGGVLITELGYFNFANAITA